jgi:hypothetical protein
MLDDAVRVRQVKRVVLEREALGRVGANEGSGILRALLQVDTDNVELRRQPDQARPAAPDVDDPRLTGDLGRAEQMLKPTRAGAS